ncbi:DUF4880 domain-containing protein [Bordetella sp. BOR01]|uniref:DUF4880 domain-containing protein n=1 Tax=Bordetella sp. BOR01 TaxID=2854779 RepID=UPI001C467A28|nr:DUF4880 domain-containing protein [Bordetella sp. BOR01]MBV7482055.1 DUF4880 domain-containing protein [Bordetella sp. BOR01]
MPDDSVAREAITWWVKLQSGEGGAAAVQACTRWRAADPRHERAWVRLEGLAQAVRGIPSDFAHAHLAGQPASRQRRTVLKGLAGALVLGGSAAAVHELTPWQRLFSDYSTRVGERRRVLLPGDIRMDLASDTAVSAEIGASKRQLTLWRGQMGILIQDADGAPPLVVQAADSRVEAVHARFALLRVAAGMRVDVYEGSLRVMARDGGSRLLSAGTAMYRQDGSWREGPVDPGEGAWTDGLLVANGDRLDAVLAQLARYRPGRLSASPDAAGLPVSGVFPLDDTDLALAMLQQTLPITVTRWGRWWVTVESADGAGAAVPV